MHYSCNFTAIFETKVAKMAKTTPLQIQYDSLTKAEAAEFLKSLEQYTITESTFYRDLKANSNSIPHIRLQTYAGLLNCEVADLIDHFVKVKPIVKKSLTKKVGLK